MKTKSKIVYNPSFIEEIKKAVYEYKKEELPDSDKPFHYESEIWSGMKYFIEWLESKNL